MINSPFPNWVLPAGRFASSLLSEGPWGEDDTHPKATNTRAERESEVNGRWQKKVNTEGWTEVTQSHGGGPSSKCQSDKNKSPMMKNVLHLHKKTLDGKLNVARTCVVSCVATADSLHLQSFMSVTAKVSSCFVECATVQTVENCLSINGNKIFRFRVF